MFNIETISNYFAENISKELKLDKDRKEVIAYGTFAIIQMIISIFLVTLFGWMFHVLIQALIVSFTISILRKYSGGVHASSPSICNIIGTVVSVGLAILLNYTFFRISIRMIIFTGILFFAGAFLIIYKVAPVDSLAKPIKTERKKRRMKKGSIFVTCSYLLVVLILLFSYYKTLENNLLLYALCIYAGVLWQIFTLTQVGHIVLKKIDTFLYQIIKRKEKNT